jgi:hypothetical protein
MTHLVAQLRRALASPGNLLTGAGVLVASAITWNPLPLILYGLGEPLWLYRATTRRAVAPARGPRTRAWHEQQLAYLVHTTPSGIWMRRGQLPDYATAYAHLVEIRAEAARVVAAHRDEVASLEAEIVARLDDMLCSYLSMVRERLLFHCGLAKIYPLLPEPPPVATWTTRVVRALIAAPATPVPATWREDTAFISLDEAIAQTRGKLAMFERDGAREHAEVYGPMVDVLARRLEELDRRGRADRAMAAQLRIFPDQLELVLDKLATTQADVGMVVDEMKLLLDQAEDAASCAEEIRLAEA